MQTKNFILKMKGRGEKWIINMSVLSESLKRIGRLASSTTREKGVTETYYQAEKNMWHAWLVCKGL